MTVFRQITCWDIYKNYIKNYKKYRPAYLVKIISPGRGLETNYFLRMALHCFRSTWCSRYTRCLLMLFYHKSDWSLL